jgi:gas vesicle protein
MNIHKEMVDMISDKKGLDLLIGAVAGTVLGAITALLLAPKSGRELRADISDGVNNLSEKTQQAAETVSLKSKQLVETLSEKTQTAAQSVSRCTTDLTEKAKETVLTWKKGKDSNTAAADEVPVAATVIDDQDVV